MFQKTTNYKGRLVLTKAIEYYTKNEYIVSIPLNDEQFYDLVVEKDGIFTPVQCKFGGAKTRKEGVYGCNLRTVGGNGKIYRHASTEKGIIFCMRPDGICYAIPTKNIPNTNMIRLATTKIKNCFDTVPYIIDFGSME